MERYINTRRGERRSSVELDEAEIAELRGELASPASEAGRKFAAVLDEAQRRFTGGSA